MDGKCPEPITISLNQVRSLFERGLLVSVARGGGSVVGNLIIHDALPTDRKADPVFDLRDWAGGTITSNVGHIQVHAPGGDPTYEIGLNQPKATVTP